MNCATAMLHIEVISRPNLNSGYALLNTLYAWYRWFCAKRFPKKIIVQTIDKGEPHRETFRLDYSLPSGNRRMVHVLGDALISLHQDGIPKYTDITFHICGTGVDITKNTSIGTQVVRLS